MVENEKDQLARQIRMHQDRYYAGTPELSDEEFDALVDRLQAIDPQNALLREIGKDQTDGFVKRKHWMMMGSQQKATSVDEIQRWAAKYPGSVENPWVVEPKCDGISVESQYTNGELVAVVTRGDGIEGDDITVNAVKMKGCLLHIDPTFTGAIRGEIVIEHAIFAAKYKAIAKNPRNMAAGVAKRRDGQGMEDLTIITYDAVKMNGEFENEYAKMVFLREQGFRVAVVSTAVTVDGILAYHAQVAADRNHFGYDVDGLVIKVNAIDRDDMQRDRPMKQIAFKFPPQMAISKLLAVEWSESGSHYTPVAVFEPVRIAGTTVERASLANPNIIKDLGLKLGNSILVSKRGDIIPKIEKVVITNPTDQVIPIPTQCSCGAQLINDGTALYCPNDTCPKKAYQRFKKWIDKLDIKDFGDLILTQLFAKKRIQTIADLYTLTVADLTALDRVGAKLATKVLANLHSVKTIPLAKFVAGFNIDGIGEGIVDKFVDAGYDTLEKLYHLKDHVATIHIKGIGDQFLTFLINGMVKLYDQMQATTRYITIPVPVAPVAGGSLDGKSFCFTGKLNTMKRDEAEALVKQKGGTIKGVTKGLTYLVTNDTATGTAKNEKAKALGVAVISEAEFLHIVGAN